MPSFTRRTPAAGASSPNARSGDPTLSLGGSSSSSSSYRSTSVHAANWAGTRPSPSAPGLRLLPSGLGSLDDLLGGGLPLGSVLVLLAPDTHTAWARLVARHVFAQGVVSGQRGLVVGPTPSTDTETATAQAFVRGMPWIERDTGDGSESEGEGGGGGDDGRSKIAWRYDRMTKFQTTVGTSQLAANLTVPHDVLAHLEATGKVGYVASTGSPDAALEALAARLALNDSGVTRVAVPDLGDVEWGEMSADDVRRFLLSLRALVRSLPASAVVTLPARLSRAPPPSSTGAGSGDREAWIRSLAWCSDACIELVGFGSDPTLAPLFAPSHGLLHLHSHPTTHHLLAPALRHSALLGVSQSAQGVGSGSGGGAGENNLGFRLKRKKFVVETVHLGIEGGTSERRTEPPPRPISSRRPPNAQESPVAAVDGVEGVDSATVVQQVEAVVQPKKTTKPRAKVRFGDDEVAVAEPHHDHHHHGSSQSHTHTHSPRVAIRHDRPDLYEF